MYEKLPFQLNSLKIFMIFTKWIIIQWQMLKPDVNLTLQWYLTVKNNSSTDTVIYNVFRWQFQRYTDWKLPEQKSTQPSMLIPQLRDWWLPWTVLHLPEDCYSMTWHGKNMVSGAMKQIILAENWLKQFLHVWTCKLKGIKFCSWHKWKSAHTLQKY